MVKKGKRRATGPDGRLTAKELLYLGYKGHVRVDAETGLITTIMLAGGSTSDARQFAALLAHDQAVGIAAEIYVGDKAHDDTDAPLRLWSQGKHSALRLNDQRAAAANLHREDWLRLQESSAYQAGLPERYEIERKFGEAKRWHGLGQGRYLRLLRYGIQAYPTALVLNLKPFVTLLTGVRCRPGERWA